MGTQGMRPRAVPLLSLQYNDIVYPDCASKGKTCSGGACQITTECTAT